MSATPVPTHVITHVLILAATYGSNLTFTTQSGEGCYEIMHIVDVKKETYYKNSDFDKLLCSYTDTNGKTVPITSANNCSSDILTGGKYIFNCNVK